MTARTFSQLVRDAMEIAVTKAVIEFNGDVFMKVTKDEMSIIKTETNPYPSGKWGLAGIFVRVVDG